MQSKYILYEKRYDIYHPNVVPLYMWVNIQYGIYHVIKNHSIVYLREMLSFGNTRRSSKKNTEENIQ